MGVSVLQRPTLVLNRHWQPVHVATVARSLGLALEPRRPRGRSRQLPALLVGRLGEADAPDGELFIRTVRFRLRVPEVLTLTRHDRPRYNAVTFSRRNLFKRDHTTCQYCGGRPGTAELTIDHVMPTCPRRSDHLGELRAGLCRLQCPQSQPYAGPGRHEAPQDSRSAQPGSRSTTPPSIRIARWSRFLSDAYWNVPLEDSD